MSSSGGPLRRRLRTAKRESDESDEVAVGRRLGDDRRARASPRSAARTARRVPCHAGAPPPRVRRPAGAGVEPGGDRRVLVAVQAPAEDRRVRGAPPVREGEVHGQERAARPDDVEAHVAVARRGGPASRPAHTDIFFGSSRSGCAQPIRTVHLPDPRRSACASEPRPATAPGRFTQRTARSTTLPARILADELEEMDASAPGRDRRRTSTPSLTNVQAGRPSRSRLAGRGGAPSSTTTGRRPTTTPTGYVRICTSQPSKQMPGAFGPVFGALRPRRETSGPCDMRHDGVLRGRIRSTPMQRPRRLRCSPLFSPPSRRPGSRRTPRAP